MMNRRTFLCGLTLGTLSAPLAVEAKQRGKVARIGYLSPDSPPPFAALWQGIHELGFIEGQNIFAEYRWAEGNPARLPDLATELVRLKVDAIFAWGYLSTRAAQNATSSIPIVFVTHADPVAAGFVASLARPGGNVTGLTMLAPDLAGKRLEILKELVPRRSRVAILANTTNPGEEATLKHLEVAARTLKVDLQVVQARAANELDGAVAAIVDSRTPALHVNLDPLFMQHRTRIVELVAQGRLPAIYDVRQFVEVGGLMSYGPSIAALIRRAGYQIARILKGAKPADLPVEQPAKFELVINLKTAKALGLTIPPSLLLRADQVIE